MTEIPAAVRGFTIPDFERVTPDLSGGERLAVFLGLPHELQAQAWAELSERIERQGRAEFAEHRLGGSCTAGELAREIAAVWDECRMVPLAGVEPTPQAEPASQRDRLRRTATRSADGDLEDLRAIPSSEYVPRLTGRVVAGGFVQCPLHAGGGERTPSLHVRDTDGRWYCHACAAGGDLFAFCAALGGRPVPHGAEFLEFAGEIAGALR